MAFEDFLRSIPLVHKHIMRTRRMMHENRQFRKFLERNGINASAVIDNEGDVDGEHMIVDENAVPNSDMEAAFKAVATSLRTEQRRAATLEASLYVLQIDYNNLLLQSEQTHTRDAVNFGKAKPHKTLKDKNDT